LAALAAAHTPVYRTDLNGTIEVSSDGTHLWVQTER
jgi:beta-lactamase superfamily II metal-dependent hydrolase